MRFFSFSRTTKTALLFGLVLMGCFLVVAEPAFAQVNTDFNEIALGDTNLLDTVQIFINIFLGILALIAVVIVLYGGFMWMTSGGNADKIERAKLILRNAAIGLVIIMASWGIVLFVFGLLSDGTGTGSNGTPSTGGGTTIPASSSSFYVQSTTPEAGEVGASLCAVQVRMSEYVDTETVTDETFQLRVLGGGFDGESCSVNSDCGSGMCSEGGVCVGDNVEGNIGFGPGESTKYFSLAPVDDLLTSTTYEGIVAGGSDGVISEDTVDDGVDDSVSMSNDYTWTFTTGTEKDEVPPTVLINGNSPFPENGATDVCLNTVVNFDFSEAMLTTSFNDQQSFVLAENTGSAQWENPVGLEKWNFGGDFDYAQARPADELQAFTTYSTRLFGGDPDDNFAGAVTDLCGNALDGNGSGVAEGAPLDNFFASKDIESESPITWNTGENAECTPVIENIDPTYDTYGEAGTLPTLTITGKYLGPHPEVEFQGSKVYAADGFNTCFDEQFLGNVEGNTAVGSACINDDDQTSDELKIKTPVGSTDSNITVTVAEEKSEAAEQTIDVQSPYIRGLSPDDGAIGQYITISGDNFGDTPSRVIMRSADGNRTSEMSLPEACGNVWSNDEIVAVVPETYTNADTSTGTWQVGEVAYIQVQRADGKYSDLQHFTFSDAVRPNLCEVVPSCSDTAGHSYTVSGEGFGDSQSGGREVVYTLRSDSTEYLTSVGSWSDTAVEGETDGAMPQGEFYVSVYDGDGGFSNARKYEIPCSTGPQVVELNQCAAEEGIFPAPNPDPNSQNACRNANIGVLFDQQLDTATLNSGTVIVEQLNSGEFNPDYNGIAVEGYFSTTDWRYTLNGEDYFGFQYNITRTFVDGDQDGNPDGGTSAYLQPDTWYQVVITDGVTNTSGVGMQSAYTMRFKTREGDELCKVDTVDVSPADVVMNQYWDEEVGDRASQGYVASSYGESCELLDSSQSSWNWNIDDITIGDFGKSGGSVSAGDETQTVYVAGNDQDNEGTANVTAAVNDDDASDSGDFEVDLAFCTSDADCSQCSNSYGQQSVCNLETSRCTPVIQSFTPDDGKEGTWATIQGCMFGSGKGTVYWNEGGQSTETAWPNADQCGDTWTADTIVVEVPEGLPKDPHHIEVETGYGDKTSLESVGGPTFSVNDTSHPGICKIEPDSASEFDGVTIQGNSLGEEKGTASFAGDARRIAADDEETQWQPTVIDTEVAAGAVTAKEGFVAVLPGGDQQQCPADDQFCSNSLAFEVSCSNNLDCATGCCSDSGVCTDAAFCSSCTVDSDCEQGGQCGGSQCSGGICTPVINDIYYETGPALSPVTITGCYFGNYNADQSSVVFGESQANLFCNNGWSDTAIIAEVPSDIPLNETVGVNVNTINGPAANAQSFTVTNQCSNGGDVPEGGVPLLCDLYPATGQYPSGDGSVEGTKVRFSGDNFVDGEQTNIFTDANSDDHAGEELSVISNDTSTAVVPADMTSSGTAEVDVSQCRGNALEFGIQCAATEDCAEGSYCVDGYCTASACGVCTPGTADSACRGNDGCYLNSDYGEYCCGTRPEVVDVTPSNGRDNVCPNAQFSLEFSEEITNESSIQLFYQIFGDGEEVKEQAVKVSFTDDPDNPAKKNFAPVDGWEVTEDLDDGYKLIINSNTEDDTGVVSAETGLALLNGTQEYSFKLAPNECAPDSMTLQNVETSAQTYTFTQPSSTTQFQVAMRSSDGQLLQPSPTMGWEFAWSPYEDDQRCDDVAWVDLPAPAEGEEDVVEPSASSEVQRVVSGNENDGATSIAVRATPTAGWEEGDLQNTDDTVEASIFTYFCKEGATWLYEDSDADSLDQNLRMIYCTDTGLPRLDTITVTGGSSFDDFFRQYLFVNPDNEEQAFALRVIENADNLSAEEWYNRNVPNPGSTTNTTVDGYEAVRDGNTYYVAASNIINGNLFNNIYLFTFNDEEQVLAIADQILESIKFNTNVGHGQCEASNKNKLVRDTKRINDIGTLQLYADRYYDEQNKYPRPKSESFGSYIEAFTTSVWPSWQGALGNLFGTSLGEDPFNFYFASEDNTPWLADTTPWLDEEGEVNDCPNIPSENVYFDESGTCWDDVNKTFFCPENSYTYAYKIDEGNPTDSQEATVYARMEYVDKGGDEYATKPNGLISACDDLSRAECSCYNYAATVTDGGDWTEISD